MYKSALVTIGFVLTTSIPAVAQQYCEVGSEQWVEGCEASCTDSWEGGDCPRTCTATGPAGFVIMNYRATPVSVNNGGHDVSRIAADQSFDYARRVEQAYNYALEIAANAGDNNAEARIRDEGQRAINEALSFTSSHQMVLLSVNASKHGSWLDRKRGWSHYEVDLLVKCVVPPNLENQLLERYGLR